MVMPPADVKVVYASDMLNVPPLMVMFSPEKCFSLAPASENVPLLMVRSLPAAMSRPTMREAASDLRAAARAVT